MRREAKLSTVQAAASYLGVPETELKEAIEAGELRVVGPHEETLIHEADLVAYLNACSAGPAIPINAASRNL